MQDGSKDIKHMRSKIIVTEDNSKTLLIPALNETYHSTKGAITEALHVFIKEGFDYINKKEIDLFEMGFGTGLNALITLNHAANRQIKVNYECIEAYPVTLDQAVAMEYTKDLALDHLINDFKFLHQCPAGTLHKVNPFFSFIKREILLQHLDTEFSSKDLIYFDAFGPKVQAELWTEEVLLKMHHILKPKGVLVTYCAQGQFKRNLKAIGFQVESIPGPPGKREMTRAIKLF